MKMFNRRLCCGSAAQRKCRSKMLCFYSQTFSPYSILCTSEQHRYFSSHTTEWMCTLRYGATPAPLFGSWENAYNEDALFTRQLYCKALLYISGGSRLARDWIAGCTALVVENESLLHTSLQYHPSEHDIIRWREHLLQSVLKMDDNANIDNGSKGEFVSSKEISDSTSSNIDNSLSSKSIDLYNQNVQRYSRKKIPYNMLNDDDTIELPVQLAEKVQNLSDKTCSAEEMCLMENTLLHELPELRCFLYDAMAASLFHLTNDYTSVEEVQVRVFSIAEKHFDMPQEILDELWRFSIAEQDLRKNKLRTLGNS